jgi:prepilin signal peptidase PulO-like enzyme (type II secretory pathway)
LLALALLPPAVQYAFAVVIGLCVGSFINVVAHRVPVMMQRAWRRNRRSDRQRRRGARRRLSAALRSVAPAAHARTAATYCAHGKMSRSSAT